MAFIIVSIVHLAAIIFKFEELRYITKLLLMPILAVTVFTASVHPKRYLVILALLFSFAGDAFLLLDTGRPFYFILGLIAFLIAHVLYVVFFLSSPVTGPSLLRAYPLIPGIIFVYGFALVYFLYPGLGTLKIPVMVYALVICSMLLCSVYAFKAYPGSAGFSMIVGALLFVLSDSLLAIDKFYQQFSLASFLIMLTYCGAQYFISSGFIKINSEEEGGAPQRI